jgi:hypothetical protein
MSLITDYISTLTADEQEAVLGGNAQKFWKLGLVHMSGDPA